MSHKQFHEVFWKLWYDKLRKEKVGRRDRFAWEIFSVLALALYYPESSARIDHSARSFVCHRPPFYRSFTQSAAALEKNRRISQLRQELRANPHHASSKLELARLLIDKRKYREALVYLREVEPVMSESADVSYEIGLCLLKTDQLQEGLAYMTKALELNPRVKYGDPYLQMGEALAESEPRQAVDMLERFRDEQSSSVEAYYRLGLLYRKLGRTEQAKEAFRESVDVYKSLPKYSRRKQRRWAILARFK